MAQTLRGDLTSEQEADLIDLLAAKVSAVELYQCIPSTVRRGTLTFSGYGVQMISLRLM